MRTFSELISAAAAVACLLCSWTAAQAAAPEDNQPEMKAFVGLAFGAHNVRQNQFAYGLRIDHDHRFNLEQLPAIAELRFDSRGFSQASLNGLPFARRVMLHQDDGGDGSSDGGDGSTGAGEREFTAVDWALIAVGVAGVGFAIAEVARTGTADDPH